MVHGVRAVFKRCRGLGGTMAHGAATRPPPLLAAWHLMC